MATAVSEKPAKSKVKKPDHSSKGSTTHSTGPNGDFDPDSYRMTIGEHLEELRTRMILGIVGFVLACIVCFIFGEKVVWYFCRPLMQALAANGYSPQIYFKEVSETFMVYVKCSMITAAAFASPWIVYQLWQFVAAGLYPHERKYITKYLPLSITLLISGMVFLYFVVLPLMLRFFVGFSIGLPIRIPSTIDPNAPTDMTVNVPVLQGDPAQPRPGTMWFDATQGRLKFAIGTTETPEIRVIPYGSSDIATPQITLDAYIDMVLNMLLSFGVAFQMPLVVLTIVRIGIADVPTLKSYRRYVYFATSVIAAVIVPDVVGGMIALMVPLILLFELGLWLARDPGQHTDWRSWAGGRWTATQRAMAHAETRSKVLKTIGVLLLVALLVHIMYRRRHPVPESRVHPSPAATQPATQPATRPATPSAPPPTTQGSAAK